MQIDKWHTGEWFDKLTTNGNGSPRTTGVRVSVRPELVEGPGGKNY